MITFVAMTTRNRILKEALNQFNEKGIQLVGVREIARSLNMSPGNLSYHFPKREDLLTEILKDYSEQNQVYRQEYLDGSPSIKRFVNLLGNLFENQYRHRGIFTELVEVNRLLKVSSGFDYTAGQSERIAVFEIMIEALQRSGELKPSSQVRTHLVSFLTLFGRFWISEAFLSNDFNSKEKTIDHYLNMMKQQLGLLATEQGLKALEVVKL